MRDVPRGQYVCSPSFSVAAVRNMHMEFYPNGLEGSKSGYCGLYYSLNLTLSVGSATRGPSRTELDGNSAKGLPEFCKIEEQLEDKQELVISIKVADMDSEAMGLMKAIQGHPDPDASRPDFLLCGDTVLFCHLLRRAGFFRDIPALHMYGMVFLQYVPVSMGIAIPFVPSSGTSDSAGVLYQPPGGAEATANAAAAAAPSTAQRRVVLLKSGFFALAPGRVFDVVLRRLTHDVHDGTKRPSGATGRTTWHFWGTETTKVFLNFATMASYSCAVYDVYGIGLPVLAPEILWHQRLLQHMFASWGQLHNEHDVGRRPPESKQQDQDGPSARAHASSHPPEHLKFWLPLAEVHRWPHVVPFASLTELLRLVETVDLRAVSARMQATTGTAATGGLKFDHCSSLESIIFQTVSET
eukprot:g4029.t1